MYDFFSPPVNYSKAFTSTWQQGHAITTHKRLSQNQVLLISYVLVVLAMISYLKVHNVAIHKINNIINWHLWSYNPPKLLLSPVPGWSPIKIPMAACFFPAPGWPQATIQISLLHFSKTGVLQHLGVHKSKSLLTMPAYSQKKFSRTQL